MMGILGWDFPQCNDLTSNAGLEALNPQPLGQVGGACVSHDSPVLFPGYLSNVSISFGGAPPPKTGCLFVSELLERY